MKFFKKIGNFFKSIILFPVKLIERAKQRKKEKYFKRLNERIDLIKMYVAYCEKKNIDFNITSNYDNELIFHLTNNTKFKVAKPLKANHYEKEKESE